MKFLINKNNSDEKIEVLVCHDICGNIFLKYKESFYCLTINSTDDIEFVEFYNFKEIENPTTNNSNLSYSKIINTFEKQSLKGKLIKELDDQDYNEEEDEIENEGHYITKYKSYPEEKLYISDTTTKNEINETNRLDDSDEPFYKFSKFGDKVIMPCLKNSLDDLSIYDTFILNDNTSCVLLTLQSQEKSNYRVSISTNGTFMLNIVGTKIKIYSLDYKINELNETEIKTTLIKTQFV